MLKIYNNSGKVHQEIPIDESINKYSDLIPLVNKPKPRENLFYGENKIKYKCKTILIDSDGQDLDNKDEIDFEDDIYTCFEMHYKLELKSRFESNIPFPSFITEINLRYNEAKLPSKWPESLHKIRLWGNTAELPDEWPASLHTIYLEYNKAELPDEWPESLHKIDLWRNEAKLPSVWPESLHTINLGVNKAKLPSKWPGSLHKIDLWRNEAKLPSVWPESLRAINLWRNKAKLPSEWPESVHTISVCNNLEFKNLLSSDIRLEKVSKDEYSTHFKLKVQ